MAITPLFKKLNFKQHKEILILNHPSEFEASLNDMRDNTTIRTSIQAIGDIEFVLAFVTTRSEINAVTPLIDQKLKGDGVVWFAYPKGSSKKYKAEINRDNGWETLGKSGFEAVRQVAINDDWSAVRFRKVVFIKTMKRRADFAMTKEGRAKASGPGKQSGA